MSPQKFEGKGKTTWVFESYRDLPKIPDQFVGLQSEAIINFFTALHRAQQLVQINLVPQDIRNRTRAFLSISPLVEEGINRLPERDLGYEPTLFTPVEVRPYRREAKILHLREAEKVSDDPLEQYFQRLTWITYPISAVRMKLGDIANTNEWYEKVLVEEVPRFAQRLRFSLWLKREEIGSLISFFESIENPKQEFQQEVHKMINNIQPSYKLQMSRQDAARKLNDVMGSLTDPNVEGDYPIVKRVIEALNIILPWNYLKFRFAQSGELSSLAVIMPEVISALERTVGKEPEEGYILYGRNNSDRRGQEQTYSYAIEDALTSVGTTLRDLIPTSGSVFSEAILDQLKRYKIPPFYAVDKKKRKRNNKGNL